MRANEFIIEARMYDEHDWDRWGQIAQGLSQEDIRGTIDRLTNLEAYASKKMNQFGQNLTGKKSKSGWAMVAVQAKHWLMKLKRNEDPEQVGQAYDLGNQLLSKTKKGFFESREQLDEGIFDVAGKIVLAANNKFNEITGLNAEMYGIKRGGKVWTRGDGVRYKDPASIYMPELNWLNKNRGEQIKPHFKNDAEKMDLVWDMIKAQGQHIGQVSGEFASSEYNDAYKLGGVIFVRRGHFSISFTTPKVFKNMDVWKKK